VSENEKAPLMGTPTDPVIPWGTLPVPDEGLQDAASGYPSRRTLPEALDAAKDGKEFQQVIQGLFRGLEAAMDAEKEDDGR
jgi:hypothetical protein